MKNIATSNAMGSFTRFTGLGLMLVLSFGGQLQSQGAEPDQIEASTWMQRETLPWSVPVDVLNEEGGSDRTVFDRDYPTGLNVRDLSQPGLLSSWSRRRIELFAYGTQQSCVIVLIAPICKINHPLQMVGKAKLKIGNQIIALKGGHSLFTVDDELAEALSRAEPQPVLIRFSNLSGSDTSTRIVGAATVRAWKQIYSTESDNLDRQLSTLKSQNNRTGNNHSQTKSSASSRTHAGAEQVANASIIGDDTAAIDLANWRYRENLPWSQTIQLSDPFDGVIETVLDRDYRRNSWSGAEMGLISNWSRQSIWLHLYAIGGGSSWSGNRRSTYQTYPVLGASLRTKEGTFQLNAQQLDTTENRIIVNDELSEFLRSSTLDQAEITIQMANGKTETFHIGAKTVRSWHSIYRPIPSNGPANAPQPAAPPASPGRASPSPD